MLLLQGKCIVDPVQLCNDEPNKSNGGQYSYQSYVILSHDMLLLPNLIQRNANIRMHTNDTNNTNGHIYSYYLHDSFH